MRTVATPSSLYCFPHAGGSAQIFSRWATWVPDGVEVVPMELPGRWRRLREPHPATLVELVDDFATTIATQRRPRVVLLGTSFGALIAYEVARVMEQRGQVPHALIAISASPPRGRRSARPIHHLPDDAFLVEVERRFGDFPQVVRRERSLRTMFLRVLREDLRLLETHVPSPDATLSCPIHVVVGHNDTIVDIAKVPSWSACTVGPSTVNPVAGDHFFFRSDHAVSPILETLLTTP